MKNRIPSLDGLRAISILLVITEHVWRIPYIGPLGVQIFFVISGYLITRLLQEEQERNGSISLKAFYLRRSFRILPAAFAFMLFWGFVLPECRPDLPFALSYTMSYNLHPATPVFFHLWSLSVEEQFYLLWPLLLVFGFAYRGRIAIGAMVAAAAFRLCFVWLSPADSPWLLHYSFPAVMDGLAAGGLLAIYGERCKWICRRYLGFVLPVAILVSAAVLWRGTFPDDHGSTAGLGVALWGLIPLMAAGIVAVAVERRYWILNNPIATGIGVLSYSLYLWQQPFTVSHNAGRTLAVLTVAVMAALSYLIVERPAIAFGRKAARQSPHKPALQLEVNAQ
jgi:peptidoglycan/LPS O-acetylase OafA/YrhL